jgi:YHS domain-containing protein
VIGPPRERAGVAATLLVLLAALVSSAALAQRFVPGENPQFPKIKYADSLVSLNDRCIVQRSKLNLKIRPAYVNWRPIGFCCKGCPEMFMLQPEKFLKQHKVDIRCVVNQGRNANPDAKRRAYVNREIYFLSTPYALTLFKKNTLKYCGWVTDPVSGVRFRPTASSPRMTYEGVPFYFSTHSTRMQFEARPDSFGERKDW